MVERLEDYALGERIANPKGVIKKVALIGGGSMGKEIAIEISKVGIEVLIIDLSKERLEEIKIQLGEMLDARINKWGMTMSEKKVILSRINLSIDYCDLENCNIVIECIKTKKSVSSIEDRKEVFRNVEKCVSKDTVIGERNLIKITDGDLFLTRKNTGLIFKGSETCFKVYSDKDGNIKTVATPCPIE